MLGAQFLFIETNQRFRDLFVHVVSRGLNLYREQFCLDFNLRCNLILNFQSAHNLMKETIRQHHSLSDTINLSLASSKSFPVTLFLLVSNLLFNFDRDN